MYQSKNKILAKSLIPNTTNSIPQTVMPYGTNRTAVRFLQSTQSTAGRNSTLSANRTYRCTEKAKLCSCRYRRTELYPRVPQCTQLIHHSRLLRHSGLLAVFSVSAN